MVIAVGATPVFGQNLLLNGTFDTDTSGWTGFGGGWVADDCCGNAASGSAKLSQQSVLIGNCIEATEGSSFDLTLWSKFAPIIQPPQGLGYALVIWSTDASCADFIGFPNAPYIYLGNDLAWQHFGATFVAPAGAHSVHVELEAAHCGTSCGGLTNFDDVAFGPRGTVPVELQSFGID